MGSIPAQSLSLVRSFMLRAILQLNTFNVLNKTNFSIVDNTAIHHTHLVVDAINAPGALLIFLHPYSPGMMPREELFSKIKHYLAKNDLAWHSCDEPEFMVVDSFLQVTDEEIQKYIKHAEYH